MACVLFTFDEGRGSCWFACCTFGVGPVYFSLGSCLLLSRVLFTFGVVPAYCWLGSCLRLVRVLFTYGLGLVYFWASVCYTWPGSCLDRVSFTCGEGPVYFWQFAQRILIGWQIPTVAQCRSRSNPSANLRRWTEAVPDQVFLHVLGACGPTHGQTDGRMDERTEAVPN